MVVDIGGPEEICEALSESVARIVEAIKHTLERTPPELMAHIMEHGIVLAGGGATLHGLAERISKQTSLPARVCDDPLGVVARGTGKYLDMMDKLQHSNALVG